MKKLFALTTLLAALVFNLHAQTWTPGTGLLFANPTTTKVGIGTNSPQSNTMLDVRGMVGVSRWGLGGTYNASQVQGIWSISPTYLINTTTNDFGTLYGMGYAHTNAGTGSKKPIANFGHQIVYTSNGTVNASISLDYGHAYFQGNIGIGVTSPSEKLEVAAGGNISLKATANDAGDLVFKKSNLTQLGRIWTQTDGNSGMYLSSGDLMADITINAAGNVGIGTTNPTATLTVNGNILAERIDVIGNVPASDFVFEEDYNLLSLSEVEAFVKENKHLPEVPSAADFKENGYSVGEMDDILLRKVEELTLYIIEQQKLIKQLQEKVETLEGK
ncbi:MAG: hypothetical protein IPM71_14300 [Bacteroidota bacterium]|nr:MAG: hypothetical protein IPM71_14300 [Bacteroidota bacterium]